MGLLGASLAWRWTPARLLRVVPASQGILTLYLALAALASHRPVAGALFAVAGGLLFLANARVRPQALIPVGGLLCLAAIALVTVSQGGDPTFVAAMALPPLCLIGMSRLHAWSWRERVEFPRGTPAQATRPR